MPGVRQAGGVSVHTRARRAVGPHALLAVLVRGATKATGDTRGMTHVQAMETHYKGFRFRSRLEARWAMFFDMTGVKWTFEPQPVTVFGEPYLPDFQIKIAGPTYFHEVKSAHEWDRIQPAKVYLAGKIGEHDWRGQLFTKEQGEPWTPEFAVMGNAAFHCTGPFASSIGHGCVGDFQIDAHWAEDQSKQLLAKCRYAINQSDVFCAHLSTPDAFGTLIEIGTAAARGKHISLTIEDGLRNTMNRPPPPGWPEGAQPGAHDLWFAEACSHDYAVVQSAVEARAFHASIINKYSQREYRMIAGLGTQEPAIMTFGDPLDVAESRRTHVFRGAHMWHFCMKNAGAAAAVRAHRFDNR